MDPQQHCLQQISQAGSSIYYSCLFMTHQQRLKLAPIITLSWRVERIPRFTQETDIVHNQLSWWSLEIEKTFNGNASHPITRALSTNQSLIKAPFKDYLNHFKQLQQDCQIDDEKNFLEYALQHRGKLLQTASTSLNLPELSQSTLETASLLLSWIDIIDGFHLDAQQGSIYLPLSILIQEKVTVDELFENKGSNKTAFKFWNICCKNLAKNYQQLWTTKERDDPILLSIIIYSGLRIDAFKKSLDKNDTESNNCYNQRPLNGPLRKLWLSWIIRSRWLAGKSAPRTFNLNKY